MSCYWERISPTDSDGSWLVSCSLLFCWYTKLLMVSDPFKEVTASKKRGFVCLFNIQYKYIYIYRYVICTYACYIYIMLNICYICVRYILYMLL